MLELCVKKDRKGTIILGLNGKGALKDDECILGYAKAVVSDKESYFCKDKALILSPGDIVYVNDINEDGGWVEIVDFTREETEGSPPSGKDAEGIRWYNKGVELFGKGSYEEAKDAFRQSYKTGVYQMQAAYAISLCQQELGRSIEIPPELEEKTDEVGTLFIRTNLACKLIRDGYKAALVGESCVLAMIDGSLYDIRVMSFLGSFMLNAWRKEGAKTIPLTDSGMNPVPTNSDTYIISQVQGAASLPPYIMPAEGVPTSLET